MTSSLAKREDLDLLQCRRQVALAAHERQGRRRLDAGWHLLVGRKPHPIDGAGVLECLQLGGKRVVEHLVHLRQIQVDRANERPVGRETVSMPIGVTEGRDRQASGGARGQQRKVGLDERIGEDRIDTWPIGFLLQN